MSQRLRVGIVVPGWRAPGAPPAIPALEDLVWSLADRPDIDVRIVSLRHPTPRGDYRDAHGVAVTTLGVATRAGIVGRAAVAVGAVRALRDLHRAAPLDVLHAFWVDEPGAVAVAAGRLLDVPVGLSVMGGELVGLPSIRYGATLGLGGRITSQVAGRGSDAVTVGSQTLFRTVAAWMLELPLQQVPLGIDLERFHPTAASAPVPPRVVSVGALVPVKDHVLLLRAFAQVRAPGAELVIAGDGPLRAGLERLAGRLGITDRVRFLGPVPRTELPDLYRSSALLAVTSRHEAQSMVAVEAAGCGIPVVGTSVGVVPELAAAGGGMAIRDAAPASLAGAMDACLDPAEGRSMGTAARAHALAAWRLEVTVDRFADLWHHLAAHPPT